MTQVSEKLDQKIVFPLFRIQLNNVEKEIRKIDDIELFSPDSNETRLILAIISHKQLTDSLELESNQEGEKVEKLGQSHNFEHEELFGSDKTYYCANICQVNDEITGSVKERVLCIDKVFNEDKDGWYNFNDPIQVQFVDADMPFLMDIKVDSVGFKKHQMNLKKRDGSVGQRLSTVGKFISKSFH